MVQRGAEAADRCRELPFGGFGLGGGATPRRQPQCVVHVAASVCRTPRCTTCCPGTGVSGGVDRRINGEQRVVGTTRCRAGRQDAASRQASSRLLRCAPALRVTRRNVLTHRVFMAGSELPATSRPICENTSSPEVNPHILCSPFIRGFSQPPTTGRPHATRPRPHRPALTSRCLSQPAGHPRQRTSRPVVLTGGIRSSAFTSEQIRNGQRPIPPRRPTPPDRLLPDSTSYCDTMRAWRVLRENTHHEPH